MDRKNKFMNPYLAGILLGFVLLATIYITGRGLGASGAMKSVAVTSVKAAAPEHYESTAYYQDYAADHPDGPMKSWLVFEMLGVLIGAFLSGALSGRLGLKLEKGPGVTNTTRIIGAIIGGMLFGFGSQLGRGCTSGSALSGMAVMSFGGIITMLAIFGGAYALAWFFRKLWITR
ncbi:YeeE/YedE thiosulfate transporter family protein [Marinilabilia salmonicolor]|uniref:YeeE/YedE thiosulfate transporter family protein n=1 Tax=Marinilabilia salmonicolor TaxID=989 RepID=UPI00029A47EB|nr:YeeE/YedE thiosulfate transporter family protein [Marinilabilia salmonicolor]